MGESDGAWGEFSPDLNTFRDTWDTYEYLPDAGVNPALDAFCARKNLSIEALVRIGARLCSSTVLAVPFERGIKFRDIVTDRRWAYHGSDFRSSMKIIRAGTEPSNTIVLCEGETDAARLTMLYNGLDVGMMPVGAKHFPASYAAQCKPYDSVLCGTDPDAAGEAGWAKIKQLIPHAVRWRPDSGDWCSIETVNDAPDLPILESPVRADIVFGSTLMDLEVPDVASWLEHDVLPIGGLIMIHGWAKSFKSFLAFDLLSSVATGRHWAEFAAIEEPARTCIIQFEIGWPYYRRRMQLLRNNLETRDMRELWDQNYGTWQPLTRPLLAAGNREHEDAIIRPLVEQGIQVVLIDPVRRGMGDLGMNAEEDVRKMLQFFSRLQDEGITVVATHHDNKASSRGGGGDALSMTGSGAWAGDPDTIISVALPKGDSLSSSTRRNLHFTLRNSPPIAPRGFELHNDETLRYTLDAHGPSDSDEASLLMPPI